MKIDKIFTSLFPYSVIIEIVAEFKNIGTSLAKIIIVLKKDQSGKLSCQQVHA